MRKKIFFGVMLLFAAFQLLPAAEVAVPQQTLPAAAANTAVAPGATPAAAAQPADTGKTPAKSRFAGTFCALLPPVLAILLALITKEVFSSLFIGMLLGSTLAAEFAPLKTMDILINDALIGAVKSTSGIFVFLVILGALVTLISKTGAAAAFGKWAQEHVKSRRGAGFMTFLFGVLIFIDDYFNCLTVGGVMRPVTDSKRISRAKLAYIIDATAAPICMIAPISSWAAAVAQYASGQGQSGLELFIRAIPYNFYSLLTLVFIVIILGLKIDFGPMRKYEKNAKKGNDISASYIPDEGVCESSASTRSRVGDMIIPSVILIVICVFAMLYNGGFLEGKSFTAAFSDTDATVALPWGALLGFVVSIVYLLLRRVVTFKDAMSSVTGGFAAMVPAILILTFATALKNMTNLLEGREFIAAIFGSSASGWAQYLPAMIFVTATLLAFATGTSWGTFGILIPIVTTIFPAGTPLLYIGISACLAGAVCGDHCSPISDTTIMSSAGAGCDHIIHVTTQLPYALTVATVSFAGFLLAGVIQNWFVVFPLTVLLLAGVVLICKFIRSPKHI